MQDNTRPSPDATAESAEPTPAADASAAPAHAMPPASKRTESAKRTADLLTADTKGFLLQRSNDVRNLGGKLKEAMQPLKVSEFQHKMLMKSRANSKIIAPLNILTKADKPATAIGNEEMERLLSIAAELKGFAIQIPQAMRPHLAEAQRKSLVEAVACLPVVPSVTTEPTANAYPLRLVQDVDGSVASAPPPVAEALAASNAEDIGRKRPCSAGKRPAAKKQRTETSTEPASPATMVQIREGACLQIQLMKEFLRFMDAVIERSKESSLGADEASTK